MANEALGDLVQRLLEPASALAAVAAALDARVAEKPLEAELEPHVRAVLDALGARESIESATPAEASPLLAEIRTFSAVHSRLLFAASRAIGWTHADAALLESAGEVSKGFPHALATRILPELDGLSELLARDGAAFLDVGAGVAALSVEMARRWPGLRVVGVEPWAPSLALARERVRAAGLESRVELRAQRGEDVDDVRSFALAWIPGLFVPERALPAVLRAVRRALVPGGWVILPALAPGEEALSNALARLRTALFGGSVAPGSAIEALFADHGFSDVRRLPSAPRSTSALLVARRPREAAHSPGGRASA